MMEPSTTRSFLTRISSRKFLLALAVEVAALIVLFAPGRESTIAAAAERLAAIAAMVLAALGYVAAETRLDEAATRTAPARPAAGPSADDPDVAGPTAPADDPPNR